jgi:hypothetical protein
VHNGVPQGLSPAIFTTVQAEAEVFTSASGSDCGIVNVNLETSGAEIGVRSVVRRKPVVAASRAPTHGSSTCVKSLTPSTTPANSRWLRVSPSSDPVQGQTR